MNNTANLKKEYLERIVPALQKEFNYSSIMQVPVLKKIVINQGLGEATADKKIIETAINELTAITGQKAVATLSRKDISNFKLRKKMPIGVDGNPPSRSACTSSWSVWYACLFPVSATSKVSKANSMDEATTPSEFRSKSFSLK